MGIELKIVVFVFDFPTAIAFFKNAVNTEEGFLWTETVSLMQTFTF